MSSEGQQVPYIPKERKGVIPLQIWPYHSFPLSFPPFVLLCVNWMPQDTFEKSGQVERPERWTYLIRGMSFRFLLFLVFVLVFWTFGFGAFVIARRKWKWLRIDYIFFFGRREKDNFMKDYFDTLYFYFCYLFWLVFQCENLWEICYYKWSHKFECNKVDGAVIIHNNGLKFITDILYL